MSGIRTRKEKAFVVFCWLFLAIMIVLTILSVGKSVRDGRFQYAAPAPLNAPITAGG